MRYTKKIKKFLVLILGLIISSDSKLSANLDGTGGTALYLGSNYTFTNRELAKGYVRFAGGFTLPPGGRVFMRVHEPVNGSINLNGGILVLQDDLRFGSDTTITGSGIIVGNNKTIYLGGRFRPSATLSFRLSNAINEITIDGTGNVFDFTNSVELIFGQNGDPFFTEVAFRNIQLFAVGGDDGVAPFNTGATSILDFTSTQFQLDSDLTLNGGGTFNINCSVINRIATEHVTLSFRLNPSSLFFQSPGGSLSIGSQLNFVDNTSGFLFANLILDNCHFKRESAAGGAAWNYLAGKVSINGFVDLDIEPGQSSWELGNGVTPKLDCNLEIRPGSTFRLLRGQIDYNNIN